MSQLISPGPWDPAKRILAKAFAPFVGFGLICGGLWLSYVLIVRTVEAGRDINMVAAALALVPVGIGCAALFPNIVVPLLYKIIDRDSK